MVSAVTPTPEATEASKLSREIQQQLQTIASDLAIVRRIVEQLTKWLKKSRPFRRRNKMQSRLYPQFLRR
jgi:hypothetical protein